MLESALRVNTVTSASLGYPLSVFNKNSTFKYPLSVFNKKLYSQTNKNSTLKKSRDHCGRALGPGTSGLTWRAASEGSLAPEPPRVRTEFFFLDFSPKMESARLDFM